MMRGLNPELWLSGKCAAALSSSSNSRPISNIADPRYASSDAEARRPKGRGRRGWHDALTRENPLPATRECGNHGSGQDVGNNLGGFDAGETDVEALAAETQALVVNA